MRTIVKDVNWQDQQALIRYTLIAPLLDETLDPAKRSSLRRKIAEESRVSERSLYRYVAAYHEKGFAGLKPVAGERSLSKKLPENYLRIVEQAIQLKKEVPRRSVEQINFILEQEKRESSSKRFCKPHRMMLLQGDIKYGCKLPIGKNGAMVQTYLSSAIDDHSRYVIQSQFYDNQEESIVEDTFRKVILKAGKFDTAYFDNGSQYVAKQLKLSLAKLGITVRHAPVRSGKSKGKMEKFHQVADAFLREVKIHKIKTLEELNSYWGMYLEEYYHKTSHEGIREYYESLGASVPAGGITPLQEWNRDSRALIFLDTSVVAEAFLHHEQRLVDKGACISFQGRKYETRPALIGFKVEISYDPAAPETITVHYPGMEPFTAEPLKIGAFCDKSPSLPASMLEREAESSRMLSALEKKQEVSRSRMADAISFVQLRKDGGSNV